MSGSLTEADQRHALIIIDSLGLKETKKGSAVPGVKDEGTEDSQPLSPKDTTLHRAIVARAIYLSQDRSDICFAAKELSRSMANPTVHAMEKLKNFGRYLTQHVRYVNKFEYQSSVDRITSWPDTDWAG